jgi:hypothetical protein
VSSSPNTPEWTSFAEAREAIAIMPLRDLEAALGNPAPSLLPLSGWSLVAGVLLAVLFSRVPAVPALGLALALYGAVAVVVNRSRAAVFREAAYRTWVQRFADRLEAEGDDDSDLGGRDS